MKEKGPKERLAQSKAKGKKPGPKSEAQKPGTPAEMKKPKRKDKVEINFPPRDKMFYI